MFFSKAFDPTKELQNLSGKVIIVTGANTGIGYATVKHLAKKGAKVYLGSRSEEKGKAALAKLKEEGFGPGEVIWFSCDIGTPAGAKKAAEDFLQLEDRLDVLVNNAACTYDQNPTQDAITEMMMTNHIGTFQFTTVLLPLLIKTSEQPDSDVRIVTVSSKAHYQPGAQSTINFKDLGEFTKTYAQDMIPILSRYSISKLANVMFSNALQRKLASTNIICISLHPGVVNTSISTRLPFPWLANLIFSVLMKDADEGAYTSCIAAASPAVRDSADKYKGAFLVPVGEIAAAAPIAQKIDLQDDLWQTTERYLDSLAL